MDRKKLYIVGGAAVLVLGYFNYYSDETGVGKAENVVETKDVKYQGDGFKIDAKKQIDYVGKNENKFEGAKAFLKDMILSGDNAFLDSARNLALKSNILGESLNGWKFSAEEIDYDKIKDELVSNKPVSATNKDLKFSISGDSFKTDSKMSYIELRKNVVLENEKIKITGEMADYDDVTKTAVLKENLKLLGKNLGEQFKESLSGDFQQLNYNLKDKIVESNLPYKVYYGSGTLSAEKFQYNQEIDTMLLSQNVEILANGYKIKMENIEKKQNSDLIYINGKITGDNGVHYFSGDNGIYSPSTKELTISGSVELKSEAMGKLLGDRAVYNTEKEILDIYGEAGEVVYSGKDGELKTSHINYDQKNSRMKIEDSFTFKNNQYSGKGEFLEYSMLDKKGIMKNAEVITGDRILNTKIVEFQDENQLIKLPDEFLIKDSKTEDLLQSKNATYSKATGDFNTDSPFTLYSGDNVVTGTGVKYNSLTGVGTLQKDLLLQNEKDKVVASGDRGEIKKDDYFHLVDNIKMQFGDYSTRAGIAKYSFKDESITIPEKVEIVSDLKKSNFLITNPVIETKIKKLTGKDESYKASSKIVKYDYENEIIELISKGMVSNGESELKGDKLQYKVKDESMRAYGDYTLSQGNISGAGKDISINNISGDVKGGKVKLWTDKGEEFQADKIDGNLLKEKIDFLGNARGKTLDKGKITQYNGEQLRVHLSKDGKKYIAKRVELLKDSTITQENITMYSKYGDIDLIKNIAMSNNGVKIIMKDAIKGDTTVTSESAEFHMDKDIVYLNNDVLIVNKDPKKGETVATSKKGRVLKAENSVELEGDVVIDTPDAVVKAGKARYNATTKKINATGDVVVDYKIKP
ncbi:MAG: LPS export ABC transporter periplasmic protein LptC [Fusobacteriaceae bacterium]